MIPRATPGDIEWIDPYGQARVCGLIVHKATIRGMERPGDRRPDGHLTAAAKERLAQRLTEQLINHETWRASGKPVPWRYCDG